MNRLLKKSVLALILIFALFCCKRDGREPVSQSFTLVYTASINGELEPCG